MRSSWSMPPGTWSPFYPGLLGRVSPHGRVRECSAAPDRIPAHLGRRSQQQIPVRGEVLKRADKLSGAWGRHPLLGRMYLPAYQAGTERVAQLRRVHPADHILPAIYGCSGLADIVTIDKMSANWC